MRIRWRQQEIIFATVILCFKILQFLSYNFPKVAADIEYRSQPFLKNELAYNNVENYLLPVILPVLILYAAFLFINLYLLPVLILKNRSMLISCFCILLLFIAIAITFSAAYYYKFIYLAIEDGSIVLRRQSIRHGFSLAGIFLIVYGLYLFLRENIILFINREIKNRSFRISLSNTLTNVFFIYIGVFFFFSIFSFFQNDGAYIFYFFVLLPFILTCLINIYWLFPYRQRNNISFGNFWPKLLITPSVLSFLVYVIFATFGSAPIFLLILLIWLTLVLVANTVSWLLFNFQKEKLGAILTLEKKLEKKSADLQFLRSQINPHFLFNALNTLYGTAMQENAGRTAEGVQRLGDMMRFMLHENHQDKIHMSREIEYMQHYIALQQLRTQSSPFINIESNIQAAYCDHSIAPMLLIPFIENAFKHGISLMERSWIKLDLSCDETNIYFDVYNSIHKREHADMEKDKSGIGLENVKQRLSLLYPGKHELIIRVNETEHFVHLTIAAGAK